MLSSQTRRGRHEVEKHTNKLLLEFADAAGSAKGGILLLFAHMI